VARLLQVAAQHVGVALVVQNLNRFAAELDGLCIGLIGEVKAAQPVITGRESDPSRDVLRGLLDGIAIIALSNGPPCR
jgi:hypothetical protein